MAWVNVPGLAGKVYVPEDAGQVQKKHPCEACFTCQWCDENRCRVCRNDLAEIDAPSTRKRCRHPHCKKSSPTDTYPKEQRPSTKS